MNDLVVQTDSLTKWYGGNRGVSDVDLEVARGEVFGFIGPNGAGKTTTIRLLLDFIRPTSGSARIFGLDTHRSSVEVRSRVGYVPGDLQLIDRLTGDQLFSWLGRLRSSHDPAYVAELADRLALDPTRTIGDLSTGNRQKVGLVQAFMHHPELLILDEPTSGLDPLVRREFRRLIHDVVDRGATVFLSSHVLAEVEDVCGRVGTVVDGRLRSIDRVLDLRDRSRRRIRLTVDATKCLDPIRNLDSVSRFRIEPGNHGDVAKVAEMEVVGPIDELVKALGHYRVIDLLSEPLSLEELFLQSYDGERHEEKADEPHLGPQPGKRERKSHVSQSR